MEIIKMTTFLGLRFAIPVSLLKQIVQTKQKTNEQFELILFIVEL